MPRLLPLALLALGCATFQPVTSDSLRAETWLELTSAHLVVHTNVQRDVAERMVKQLERNRRALLLLWGPDVDPPGRLRVLVLKSRAQMEHFAEGTAAGLYSVDPTGPVLVLFADGGYLFGDGDGSEVTQVHELAHAVMFGVLEHQPRWLAEGLAVYLENVRVGADNTVALGKVNVRALTHVRAGGRVPLAVLRSWSGFSLSPSDTADRYGSAWAWVHFLFNERPQPFLAYLEQLARGIPDEQAWRSVFTESDAQLEQALGVYLQSGHAGFTTLPLPPVPQEVTVAPLPAAAVHATLGQLYLSASGKRTREERLALAKPELEAALKLDPQQPIARTLLAAIDGRWAPGTGAHGTAEVSELPGCPDEIDPENAIEGASTPLPRTRVAEFGAGALMAHGEEPPIAPLSAITELTAGRVGLFATAGRQSARLVLLREDAPGACVITAWGTQLEDTEGLGDIQRWTSKDLRHAVFVLEVKREKETRFVTVATDGKRAWAPLRGGASAQLIARSAKLRPQSGKLYLDVTVKGPGATVFVFRPESGSFEPLR